MQPPRAIATARSAKTRLALDLLFKNIVSGKRRIQFQSGANVFSQGDDSAAIYFIESGKVQLTVVSSQGKTAALARLGPRDFMGKECLVGSARRTSTATTLGAVTVFRIVKRAMLRALHLDPRVSEEFIASLLARTINLEVDLADQLFNHTDKRLAAALLKLTRGSHRDKLPNVKLTKVTQEALAGMVGTTAAKVGTFMNKFRSLGLIHCKGAGEITVMSERLTEAVLHE